MVNACSVRENISNSAIKKQPGNLIRQPAHFPPVFREENPLIPSQLARMLPGCCKNDNGFRGIFPGWWDFERIGKKG